MPTSPTLSETPPLHATFNPLIRPYLLAMVAWYLLLSLFGAPLILVWVLGPGQWWARHYFDRLGCTLDAASFEELASLYLGKKTAVVHERCAAKGDSYCEWRLDVN